MQTTATVTIHNAAEAREIRARYAGLARQMNAARARRDYKASAAIARKMLPLEDALNAWETRP